MILNGSCTGTTSAGSFARPTHEYNRKTAVALPASRIDQVCGTLINLFVLVVILWGLSGVAIVLQRERWARGSGWLFMLIGGLLAIWTWQVRLTSPVHIGLGLPGAIPDISVAMSPHVVVPVVYLTVLIVYITEGTGAAITLIVGTFALEVLLGVIVPVAGAMAAGLRILPGLHFQILEPLGGLRQALVASLAYAVGIYVVLVTYQSIANRFAQRWLWLSGWFSLAAGGCFEGALFAFGAFWGTSSWPGILYQEWLGWAVAVAAILPLLAIYLEQTRNEVWPEGRPPGRPALGVLSETIGLERALGDAERRAARLDESLALVTKIRRTIVRADDPTSMMEQVCHKLLDAGHFSFVWTGLFDESGGWVQPKAQAGRHRGLLPPAQDAWGDSLEDQGPTWTAVIDRRPAVVQDVETATTYPRWSAEAKKRGFRSAAALPVMLDSDLLGVLTLYSRKSEAFDIQKLDMLQSVAGDLAYGLRRLHLEQGQVRRLMELDALGELTATLLSEHDVRNTLELAIRRARTLLGATGSAVFQSDPVSHVLDCVASDGTVRISPETHLHPGDGLIGGVADHGQSASGIAPVGDDGALRSVMAAPLKRKGLVSGVIMVARPAADPFSEDDLKFLALLANHMSVAIETARLVESERVRSAELEALRQASLSLTSTLDMNKVLETILHQAIGLVSAYDAHVFLYDGEELTFGAALWAGDVQKQPFSEPRRDGLTYMVARTAERVVVPDAANHPLFDEWAWEGAIVGLPLKSAGRVLGVMNVAFSVPHEFAEEELRILELLADQAAVMLENARLYDRTEADRRRLQLLYGMTREFSSSTNVESILQRAAELTTENLGGILGAAIIVEKGTDRLHLSGLIGHNEKDLAELDAKMDMHVGKGVVGWIVKSRQAVRISDVRFDPRWDPAGGVDEEVRSMIGAPIMVGDVVAGVLAVFHREIDSFDEEHLDLLRAIANQVGLAWSNVQRYVQVERRLVELTALQHAAQVINSRMEMQPLLEEMAEQVSSSLGYEYVGIALVEGDQLVLRSGRGQAGELIRLPLGKGITGRVVTSNEASLVPDVDRDPDFVPFFPGTRSEAAVPIRKGDVAIGVLNVESRQLAGLTDDDIRLLSLLADQMAIAIENAALYERLRQHSVELETTVTERTAELAEALGKAQEADRLKTQFVSDVSHELRTPLSNIRLYLELLGQGTKARQDEYLQTLNRETQRLVTLIEDLLSISRLDAGSTPVVPTLLDLNQMAAALVEDRRKLFAARGLTLTLEASPGMPPILADENLLAQVIGNLMTNAMHYTPSTGQVGVKTELSEDGKWARLSVTDSGVGILPEEADHLFERFYRGSASRQMGNPGTGLGLAISREIIERHNGRITLSSEPGRGSSFCVWLPVTIEGVGEKRAST